MVVGENVWWVAVPQEMEQLTCNTLICNYLEYATITYI